MRDGDLRAAMRTDVLREHLGQPGTRVLEELGLGHGEVFVDVAVIHEELHGYELKSERDTLDRLPRQAQAYGAVLDRAALVASERHLRRAEGMLPPWWGLYLARPCEARHLQIERVRPAARNPEQRLLAVAALLWRDEALGLLEKAGQARGMSGKPRRYLYERLTEVLAPETLLNAVRSQLKAREGWRAD